MTFRKHQPGAPAGFFEAEAAGLRWLREVPAGARTVEVLDVGTGFIELRELVRARPTAAAARSFGRQLAATHDAGALSWGAPPDGYVGPTYIGRQAMTCDPAGSFADFYVNQRVLPYLGRAVDVGHVGRATGRLVEQVCGRLAEGDFGPADGERPSRIHGDLWNGNVFWDPAGVVLIDPAAHGGHRETDLAMLALFGVPFLDDILAGYQAAHPLEPGWRQRIPLHQLHPLAVHAASHGPEYERPLAAAASAVLAY
jgi:fructosamine-3-kinase